MCSRLRECFGIREAATRRGLAFAAQHAPTFANMHKTLLCERLGCLGLFWVVFWGWVFYWVGLAQGGVGSGWGDASRYLCSPLQSNSTCTLPHTVTASAGFAKLLQ